MLNSEQKQKRNEATKRWRQRNPDKVNAYKQKYRAEHKHPLTDEEKEKAREASSRWRAKNPDKVHDYNQKHYQENREYHQEKHRRWVNSNREKVRAKGRAQYWKNPEKHRAIGRANHLKREYGITIEQYEQMLLSQGEHCAICKGDSNGMGRFHVDHDHQTGKIRGLLCSNCNRMLGRVERLLPTILDYLSIQSQ